jgi:hypothetical protein
MKRGIVFLLTAGLVLAMATTVSSASTNILHLKQFQSPSHNIGCYMANGTSVRCDIRVKTWPTPPKPASCDVDYGQGVGVSTHGEADYVCAGDTALDDTAPVLNYGDRIKQGHIRCSSKTKGMRCVNLDTKDGFFLSRDVVHLF